MRLVSRRDFVHLSGFALIGTLVDWRRFAFAPSAVLGLGRVTHSSLRAYEQPRFAAKAVKKTFYVDTVLKLYEEEASGDPGSSKNPVWWRADEGWVHSSWVQPVRNDLNQPVTQIPSGGFLAEVSVPYSDAWRNDDGTPQKAYRFYYASTHWVDQLVTDPADRVWYRVWDDRYRVNYFVLAESLRPVPADELTPLSADVQDKRIEVELSRQQLTAFESGVAVFSAPVSTGRRGVETPVGAFQVRQKRPSRHMAATEGNGFDLPGVPWVSYIHWTGVALHGTYWHNDFGTPRSRGCINLTPADAKWLFRWTMPTVPVSEDDLQSTGFGTTVEVIQTGLRHA